MIAVDSCKIRIPLHQVNVINESLHGHWIPMEANTNTGELREVDDNFRTRAYKHSKHGISTRFAIEKQVTKGNGVGEFLVIGIHAKMIGARYLEGLHKDTIRECYNYLIELGIASFSYEAFKSSECTDVDYKKDFKCEDISELTLKLEYMTIPKKAKGEGVLRYNKDTNKGVEWSHRKSTAITKAPFAKVYSKELDLKYNSTEFADQYLQGKESEFRNLTRVEVTIKNRKHFKLYKVEDTTLSSITDLPQQIMQQMISNSINKHILKATREIELSDIPTKDQELVNLIKLLQVNRIGINQATEMLYSSLHPKTRKRRVEKFNEVWQSHFSQLPQTKQLNNLENWLETVGVQFL